MGICFLQGGTIGEEKLSKKEKISWTGQQHGDCWGRQGRGGRGECGGYMGMHGDLTWVVSTQCSTQMMWCMIVHLKPV